MIRKRNRDGKILAMAEDKRAVGVEGRGESIVSIDGDVWAALKTRATGNGRWRLTGDKRVVEYRRKRRKVKAPIETGDTNDGTGS